ncbi:P-type conjugative transfer protein TrbJ [Escherichia coli]|uniref:P-type conjugative transfer protein TrbJ n=1 Tax=Escherichia coli TaxID=562 RepID=UPI003EBAF2EB
MPPVLWRGWIPFCRYTERKKVRNKQVVLLIAGISGIATGIIVSLNIPFIRQGLFYPASPVEIVVSLCLTFSVSVVFFVGAIVGWISVSRCSRPDQPHGVYFSGRQRSGIPQHHF